MEVRFLNPIQTVSLEQNQEEQFAVALRGGRTMELCITKWWSNLGEAILEAELVFHGVVPLPTVLSMVHPFKIQ